MKESEKRSKGCAKILLSPEVTFREGLENGYEVWDHLA